MAGVLPENLLKLWQNADGIPQIMDISRSIGPFEVLERLGAGGMGEVYKARDRRLNRFVALKFLPEAAAEAARERFQREALAIAALN
ncbi:MAG: hypothetical protein ACRD1L_12460, partial [Terriglobales bacterium]